MTRLVNLCGHPVDIVLPDGSLLSIPAEGPTARVEVEVDPARTDGSINGIPLVDAACRRVVVGLPPPAVGVVYIVSTFVAAAVAYERNDVVCPATDRRDRPVVERGRTVAVRALKRLR
jgi:hypothetical protein